MQETTLQDKITQPGNSPGLIQLVPLKRIRPTTQNPRLFIRPESIQAKKASLRAVGQLTPVPVRPLTPEEKAQDPDHDYELIGGNIRYLAAKELGWEALKVEIRDIQGEDAELAAFMDNENVEQTWYAKYLFIEKRLKGKPHGYKQVLADQMETQATTISRAQRIMGFLRQPSRDLILKNLQDGRKITENAVFRLTDLGDEDLIDKTLPVLLEKEMTEPEAKKLVEWVKAGNQPEAYDPAKASKTKAVEPPRAPSSPSTAKVVLDAAPSQDPKTPPLKKGKFGFAGTQGVSPVSAVGRGVLASNAVPVQATHTPTPTTLPALGRVLGEGVHWGRTNPMSVLKLIGGWIKGLAVRDLERVHQGLIHQAVRRLFGWILAIGITGLAYLGVTHFWTPKKSSQVAVGGSQGTDQGKPTAAEPPSSPRAPSTAKIENEGTATASMKQAPPLKKGEQKRVLASDVKPSAKTTQKVQKQSAQVSAVDEQRMVAWAAGDVPFVSQFADHFYGLNFVNPQRELEYFKQSVTDGYYARFVQEYFPADRLRNYQEQKLVQSFKPTGSPRLLFVDDASDEFLVEGVVTMDSRLGRMPKMVSQKPVALKVHLQHAPGLKGLVFSVVETEYSAQGDLSPETGAAAKDSAKGDPLKGVDDAVNGISSAVNTVKEGQAAVDGARKFLGN